jgi:hypothetical protein
MPSARAASHSGVPLYGRVLLETLHLTDPKPEALKLLSSEEWLSLLRFCDAAQLTLLFGDLCRDFLPAWVKDRIDDNFRANSVKFERLENAIIEIAACLNAQAIDFALLKGLTHSPLFTIDPRLRCQGDIDIWCLPAKVFEASDALQSLGYRHVGKSKSRHLDPMVRESSWQWRGDYFASDLPIPIDLHYELWDEGLERIAGPDEAEIWQRRSTAEIKGRRMPVLDAADAVTFAALHLMMHLLHGDLRLHRAWEIAYFLHHSSRDEEFWNRWRDLYPNHVRRIQAIAFALGGKWFGCDLSEVAKAEIDRFPTSISSWIEHFSHSPFQSLFVPNKHEVWLNLALLESFKDKSRVLSRRLMPCAGAAGFTSVPNAAVGKAFPKRIRFFFNRIAHHIRLFPPTCLQGARWWWKHKKAGKACLLARRLFLHF